MQLGGFGSVAGGVGIIGQAALTKVGINAADKLEKGIGGKRGRKRRMKHRHKHKAKA